MVSGVSSSFSKPAVPAGPAEFFLYRLSQCHIAMGVKEA